MAGCWRTQTAASWLRSATGPGPSVRQLWSNPAGRFGSVLPVRRRPATGSSQSRLCENALPFRFRGSFDPSRLEKNRIQRDLRGRFLARPRHNKFSHGLSLFAPSDSLCQPWPGLDSRLPIPGRLAPLRLSCGTSLCGEPCDATRLRPAVRLVAGRVRCRPHCRRSQISRSNDRSTVVTGRSAGARLDADPGEVGNRCMRDQMTDPTAAFERGRRGPTQCAPSIRRRQLLQCSGTGRRLRDKSGQPSAATGLPVSSLKFCTKRPCWFDRCSPTHPARPAHICSNAQ